MRPVPWALSDIPDLSGRVAVVTGANRGIGHVTARELARRGARTVLACRDRERGAAALERLRAQVPGADATVLPLDLADLGSVREFPARLPEERVDLLVNNAGVMALPRRSTADGFEMQFGTNHLGHFALTGVLLPWLLASAEPRVVTVSSMLHARGRIDFGDLQGRGDYRPWRAYAQSKLANLLFSGELQRRARAAGRPLRSLAAHPGLTATGLAAAGPRMAGRRLLARAMTAGMALVGQSDEQGALPVLRAATDPDLPGDAYVGPASFMGLRGAPVPGGRSPAAEDEQTAARLWRVCEDLTGVRFDWAG
ncbi:oxidoreductase [Marinactinospora thermotolerans]|uniref:NAD(P)-dependent dehydrogenase, short-chain alcohol dehydrogenase family n=1 Tax=Marinactinospora thermotolerans DSM 45154 TaxID=1122192 RepID=A0A1T4LJZ7_9ACTN|nr:oxidoreductase [Marinactinospora thermotolerans]SJZ54877.1 NAD(P)-dependent dehydrogenase, short-chain alcohol dehydrogenase family [Marinactinospora thermotolerans DSM 45154]